MGVFQTLSIFVFSFHIACRPNLAEKMKVVDRSFGMSDSPFPLCMKRSEFVERETDEPFGGSHLLAHETVDYSAMENTRNDDSPMHSWTFSNSENKCMKADHPDSLQK